DLARCTGCGECVAFCPTHAVAVVADKVALVRPEDCNYCTECETICPAGAISCPFDIILLSGD
ncbi:MAG: 4Fe-4S binding protein, partial [Chloroflexota bacterium]